MMSSDRLSKGSWQLAVSSTACSLARAMAVLLQDQLSNFRGIATHDLSFRLATCSNASWAIRWHMRESLSLAYIQSSKSRSESRTATSPSRAAPSRSTVRLHRRHISKPQERDRWNVEGIGVTRPSARPMNGTVSRTSSGLSNPLMRSHFFWIVSHPRSFKRSKGGGSGSATRRGIA